MLTIEREYWNRGIRRLAGLDEAGRGPLAGPVAAAAVVFDPDWALAEEHGLLAGLFTFDWLAGGVSPQAPPGPVDAGLIWSRLPGHTHRFTHLIWHLDGYLVELNDLVSIPPPELLRPVTGGAKQQAWVTGDELRSLPFPVALEPFRRLALARRK